MLRMLSRSCSCELEGRTAWDELSNFISLWEWTMMKQWVAKVKGWNKVEYLHVNEAVLSHHGTRQSRVPVWWGLMHFPGCLISRDHQTTSWKSKSQRARQFIFDDLCKLGNMGKRGQGVSKGFSKTSDTTWSTTKSSNGDPTKSEARPSSRSGIFCHVRRMGIVMKLVSFPHPWHFNISKAGPFEDVQLRFLMRFLFGNQT